MKNMFLLVIGLCLMLGSSMAMAMSAPLEPSYTVQTSAEPATPVTTQNDQAACTACHSEAYTSFLTYEPASPERSIGAGSYGTKQHLALVMTGLGYRHLEPG